MKQGRETLPELELRLPKIAAHLADARSLTEATAVVQRERIWGLPESYFFTPCCSVFRDGVAAPMRSWLAEARRHETLRQTLILHALRPIMEAAAEAGIELLFVKGRAYGLRHYPQPHARPWRDIDVLVDECALDRLCAIFRDAGWSAPYGRRGRLVSHQMTWSRTLAGGVQANVDVHWKLSNRQIFARMLDTETLQSSSVVAGSTRLIDDTHALVHALLHLASHHPEEEWPAIWHLDLQLLHDSLNEVDALRFIRKVQHLQIESLCRRVDERHRREAGAALPLLQIAARSGGEDRPIAAVARGFRERFLWPDRRLLELSSDLWALGSVRASVPYLAEVLFPPEESLRAGMMDRASPLWRLHLRRLVRRGMR